MTDQEVRKIIQAEPNKSPIFYGGVRFLVLFNRKKIPHFAEKVVFKGTISEILRSKSVKRSVLTVHFDGDKKKAHKFDLDKIELKSLEINKFLGYGVKE